MDMRNLSQPAPAPAPVVDDPLWYMDAVIYQVHVKAFYDSNGDGVGDFRGLTEKLDYIRDLGVNTIWVMPFYPARCATTATTSPTTRACIRPTGTSRTSSASCGKRTSAACA